MGSFQLRDESLLRENKRKCADVDVWASADHILFPGAPSKRPLASDWAYASSATFTLSQTTCRLHCSMVASDSHSEHADTEQTLHFNYVQTLRSKMQGLDQLKKNTFQPISSRGRICPSVPLADLVSASFAAHH
jgi:hypothetical protein